MKLLYLRYEAGLVEVPDRHGGDKGIEAFSTTDGCAFQCYAPEGVNDNATLARKHKNKINRDLKKFKQNVDELSRILGPTKITRWILVVPDHCSSEVVAHCQTKTLEVKALIPPLPYVDADFQVVTVDGPKFFAAEIATLTSKGGLLVEAAETDVEAGEVETFATQNNALIDTLENKLQKIPALADGKERADFKAHLLQIYLEGENAIDYYDHNYPIISEKIRSLKQLKAKTLRIESSLGNQTIAGTRHDFQLELTNFVPGLGHQTAMTIAYAAVTEWLMLCPLRPKG